MKAGKGIRSRDEIRFLSSCCGTHHQKWKEPRSIGLPTSASWSCVQREWQVPFSQVWLKLQRCSQWESVSSFTETKECTEMRNSKQKCNRKVPLRNR